MDVQDPVYTNDTESSYVLAGYLFNFGVRTCKFLVTYLIYLLTLYIVLDFWDKLKEPTKDFLRKKITKYVDAGVLTEFFKQSLEKNQQLEKLDNNQIDASSPTSNNQFPPKRKVIESQTDDAYDKPLPRHDSPAYHEDSREDSSLQGEDPSHLDRHPEEDVVAIATDIVAIAKDFVDITIVNAVAKMQNEA